MQSSQSSQSSQSNDISEIIDDKIYISSFANAIDARILNDYKINSILTLGRPIPDNLKLAHILYKHIRIYDEEDADLLKILDECCEFISQLLTTDYKIWFIVNWECLVHQLLLLDILSKNTKSPTMKHFVL